MGPEGWKVRQQHFETITSLVRASRTFFPEGAATEIWLKFSTNVCYLQAMCTSSAAFSRISELPMVLPEDPAIKKLGTATWTSHLYMMDAVQVSTVMESAEISHCVAWMESPADLELCVLELSLHLLLRFLDCRFMDRFEPVSHLHFLNGDGYCCTAHVDTKERSSARLLQIGFKRCLHLGSSWAPTKEILCCPPRISRKKVSGAKLSPLSIYSSSLRCPL
ncbi:proteasome activator subunit 4-like [Hordeum vulgare subsp. vulgare]|uniref:proteasome activator subunit 4-like n=1 Tax=Hordeum vulgare subsp. vulgare TaxID=112509 RepID=UPI001D1A4D0C|nr:proteasome activator subunit 4-like [Hordeum vulgare subsp. vulgare]